MKKFVRWNLLLLFGTALLTGCLVTRQEVKNSVRGEPPPLTPEQVKKSNMEVQYQETEEELRKINGRVEVLENSMNILNADKSGGRLEQQNERRAMAERQKIYEESLAKLETQYLQLAQKVEALQQAVISRGSVRPSGDGDRNAFDEAEDDFSKKRWKEAIISYEKYRSQNPKGKKYAEATFKIGSAFLELNMRSEAKAFYTEVIEKYPKSDWAKKAQQRLKILK